MRAAAPWCTGCGAPFGGPAGRTRPAVVLRSELLVLDVVYILGALVLFAIVAVVGKAVAKL
ncbi:hypothetical protein [Leucobacter chromiireducens]|uniref:hypothetical protein n=1 Tax=Leucobacter chromiireducens TaxID=283877 RepID=UPI001925619C|nr:hypothetical protein [Leucobacter chromiireducens]